MKIICGGSPFLNSHRKHKERMYTLCGKFIDSNDGTFLFPEVTCPDCMRSNVFEEWTAAYVFYRLRGESWSSRVLLIESISHYRTRSWLRNQNNLQRRSNAYH